MLLEVGFWRDTRSALRRGDSVAVNSTHERSPLLQKSVSCPPDASQSTEEDDSRRPDPTSLVDHTWYMTHGHLLSMLEWYLTEGACVESHELGYSYCRFKCNASTKNPRLMGACTLTDGVYVWPEGYWHYIRCHHVKPPQEFLDHVTSNYRRALLAAKALNREFGDDVLFLWDAEFKKPVPMPAGMQQWILDNTTLQLPGESKKKTPVDVGRRPWDCLTSSMPNWCGCIIS